MKKGMKIDGKLGAYLLWPLFLTLLLIFMNIWIYIIDKQSGYIMSIFVLIYFFVSIAIYYFKINKIETELTNFAMGFGQSQKQLLKEMALPYGILSVEGKLLWANDEFMDVIMEQSSAKRSITNIFPEIVTDLFPQTEVDEIVYIEHDDRDYKVVLRRTIVPGISDEYIDAEQLIKTDENVIIAIYLYDETEMKSLKKEHTDQKQVIGLLYIDNYEEALESVDEVRRSLLSALVERKINKYMQGIDAIIKKLEKDKYIFVFKQKHLQGLRRNKFSLLEEVRSVNIGNDMEVTISMGLGVNADTYLKGYEYSRAAIDLALGRGGDQAVIKDGDKLAYYGGKSVHIEKGTRVKARVRAHALKEFMEGHDKVVVMGHKIGDVDSFGAAIGIYRIAKTLNRKVNIVINEVTSSLKPMMDRFINSPEYEEDLFIKSDRAIDVVDEETLLVIVDVNRPSYTECEELLDLTDTIVVLDHHRQSGEAIHKAVLSYIEPHASSTCEMVAEISQYIGEGLKLRPMEADALYAGIMIDTNNFLTKTGVRTFEAAAFLRRSGADISRIRKLFRGGMIDFKIKADAISSTEVYRGYYAFAVCEGEGEVDNSPTVLGAQVSNELLNIVNVKATFVLTPFKGKIYVSARSIDEVNVQTIMEKLGGGGHLSVAGAQFEDQSIEEVKKDIMRVLDKMIKNEEI